MELIFLPTVQSQEGSNFRIDYGLPTGRPEVHSDNQVESHSFRNAPVIGVAAYSHCEMFRIDLQQEPTAFGTFKEGLQIANVTRLAASKVPDVPNPYKPPQSEGMLAAQIGTWSAKV